MFSRTPDEHLEHLEHLENLEHLDQVFTLLAQHKLYAKASKCVLNKADVQYLGLLVGGRQLRVDLANDTEIRYTVGEQELLAVIHALKNWRCYLHGCPGGGSPL